MALDLIKKQVYEYMDQILYENRAFYVNTLRENRSGENRNERTSLGVFRLSIIDLEKLVANGQYQKSTLVKYNTAERHLSDFLRWKGNIKDILLVDFRIDFIKNF